MEQLIFDSGIKEYQINGKGVLRFNPSDPNVYERFFNAVDKIHEVEKEMAEKAKATDQEEQEAAGAIMLKLMREMDVKIKNILNDVFGFDNDFDSILCGVNLLAVASNGNRVVVNLLEALQPIMEAGAKVCADKDIAQAKMNREQRRAMHL